MDPSERERLMVECYGEACSFVMAGKVIGRSPATIRKMAGDGRIATSTGTAGSTSPCG